MSKQKTKNPSVPLNPPDKTVAVTAETLERLIAEAQYQQHPYGKVWQRFDLDTFSELVGDIDRRGLDQCILLYQGMILEGWHRYLACLFTKTQPKLIEFQGTELEAAERVHASGIRRQSNADQRYAAFLLLGDACREFKDKYEQLKQKGIHQQTDGTPLSTDGQRVDVVGAKAAAARVGRSTAAKVEKVKKTNPEAVSEIAAGKTTANKELKKIKAEEKSDSAKDDGELPPPCRLGSELAKLTQPFTTLLGDMDGLDWSKEKESEWDEARDALNKAIVSIFAKAQEGFENARSRAASDPPVKRLTKPKKTPEVLSIRKLKSLYGDHAVHVLDKYLEKLPKKKGAMRQYKVVKPLPTQDEYKELQKNRYTSTVADLVDSAFSAFEDLAGELSDWYDSLPEAFQGGDKGSALEDARSLLESLSHPDVDERIGAIEVCYLPLQDVKSRASRCNDAVGRLQAVVDALDPSKGDEEIQSLVAELENAIGEAESVEFPGMY